MNLDCNLQTIEEKPATAIDVGGSAKQTIQDVLLEWGHDNPGASCP